MRGTGYLNSRQAAGFSRRRAVRVAQKILRKAAVRTEEQYALIRKGNLSRAITGTPWVLAKKYLKRNHIQLGLKKEGGQLFYFLRFRGNDTWVRCRAITDTGDFEANKRIALDDYFHNGIRLQQAREGFKLIKLN